MILQSLAIAFLWSLGGILQKYTLKTLSSQVLLIVSGIIYAIVILVYGLMHRTEVVKQVKATNANIWIAICVTVLLSMFLSILWLFDLLKKYDAHKVNTLTYVAPVFTLLLAVLFLNERPSLYAVLGIFLVVAGIVLIASTCRNL